MITGTGLLAKSLEKADSDNCILFCSGVSNSSEKDLSAFEREKTLLEAQDRSKKLVYFSTISVFNPAKIQSPYIVHKLEMEKLISTRFPDFLILRLPNMVGAEGNPNNLFPYFRQSILQNSPVLIHANARRHLLSTSDLPHIVAALIRMNVTGILNVFQGEAPLVSEIYEYMCRLLHKQPRMIQGPPEEDFSPDNSTFIRWKEEAGLDDMTDWKQTISFFLSSWPQT